MRFNGWVLVNVPDQGYCLEGDILVHSGDSGTPRPELCESLIRKKAAPLYKRSFVGGHKEGFWVLRPCTEPELNEFGEVCP